MQEPLSDHLIEHNSPCTQHLTVRYIVLCNFRWLYVKEDTESVSELASRMSTRQDDTHYTRWSPTRPVIIIVHKSIPREVRERKE